MAVKSVLFDLDGTLTDSGDGIVNCVIPALEHFGLPIPPREELKVFVGPPLNDTFPRFGVPADRVEEAVAIFRARYIPIGIYENAPYAGIPEMLDTLQKKGYKLYVATSKVEAMAEKILAHFGLAQYFTKICGASMDFSRNTKEAVIEHLLKETGESDSMIMVGDTTFDIVGAKYHGIPAVGVSWGYGKVEDMVSAGACAIVDTPEELIAFLEN